MGSLYIVAVVVHTTFKGDAQLMLKKKKKEKYERYFNFLIPAPPTYTDIDFRCEK